MPSMQVPLRRKATTQKLSGVRANEDRPYTNTDDQPPLTLLEFILYDSIDAFLSLLSAVSPSCKLDI